MKATGAIDECLSVREGRLYIEECDTVELVHRFGSPLFVLSEDQLRRNIKRFQTAFGAGWIDGPVKLLPAAKANWISAVQQVIASEGCGCDVYSPGELAVALGTGMPPEFISVNGFPKDQGGIERAVASGCRITIDSLEEVDMIESAARKRRRKAFVRLRLKPTLTGAYAHSEFVSEGLIPTDVAAVVYKGGLTVEQTLSIGPRIMSSKHLELVGFHQHQGRHRATLEYWKQQMETYARDVAVVCRALGAYQPKEIDIGGGFPIPRDPFNAATDYSSPFQYLVLHSLSHILRLFGARFRHRVLRAILKSISMSPNKRPTPTVEEFAEVCTRTLREALTRHGINPHGIMLQLEPGRSLHGNTGIHLATVRGIKRTQEPVAWNHIVTDSTEFWFTGGRYEHHLHDFVVANKPDAPDVQIADVIGRSCYGDRLLPTVKVPDLQVGDIIALLDTGSYQEVSSSNFNALPRPATVMVSGKKVRIVRRRETEADVFRRDVIERRGQTRTSRRR
jgi:diaminopimelate decarboxylase